MNKNTRELLRYAWLSLAAAIITIILKTAAYYFTGSVSLLSDAAESVVNLVAAVVALYALHIASKPADEKFSYGRGKAEYFAAGIEGAMIFVAAGFILYAAIERLFHPRELHTLGIGVLVSALAMLINGIVGMILIRAGKKYRSHTLRADGLHLMTDVYTTIGVIIGIGLVWITRIPQLDSVIAILVALNILWTGWGLMKESLTGLLDANVPEDDVRKIVNILNKHASTTLRFHGLQTRASGRESFCNVDMLVPGDMSVKESHELAEDISEELAAQVEGLTVNIHVEPLEDPRSYEDIPEGYIPLGGITDAVPDAVVEALTERKNRGETAS